MATFSPRVSAPAGLRARPMTTLAPPGGPRIVNQQLSLRGHARLEEDMNALNPSATIQSRKNRRSHNPRSLGRDRSAASAVGPVVASAAALAGLLLLVPAPALAECLVDPNPNTDQGAWGVVIGILAGAAIAYAFYCREHPEDPGCPGEGDPEPNPVGGEPGGPGGNGGAGGNGGDACTGGLMLTIDGCQPGVGGAAGEPGAGGQGGPGVDGGPEGPYGPTGAAGTGGRAGRGDGISPICL